MRAQQGSLPLAQATVLTKSTQQQPRLSKRMADGNVLRGFQVRRRNTYSVRWASSLTLSQDMSLQGRHSHKYENGPKQRHREVTREKIEQRGTTPPRLRIEDEKCVLRSLSGRGMLCPIRTSAGHCRAILCHRMLRSLQLPLIYAGVISSSR